MAFLRKKDYPFNYSSDVLAIIDALAFEPKNIEVAGSMALKSQQYSADFDLYEIVRSDSKMRKSAIQSFIRGFQNNIKELKDLPDCYIGDIKCGEVSEWRVVDGDVRRGHIVGYSAEESRKKVDHLENIGVLSDTEADAARALIKTKPTVEEYLMLSKELRPHVVRWSPADVLRGFLYLRNGRRFTLEDGICSPAITKVDVVALVNKSRYADFSCIYSFRWKTTVLNNVDDDPIHELKKNIVSLYAEENYYKMAKRIFSVLKNERRELPLLGALSEMFNSDLGRLYSIISDIGTLIYLLENEGVLSLNKIKYEVGQFRSRMGNIFETDAVNTKRILSDLMSLETASRARLVSGLKDISNKLTRVLNSEAGKNLKKLKLVPLPEKLKP